MNGVLFKNYDGHGLECSYLGVVANQKSLTKEEQSYIMIKRDDIEYEVEFPQVLYFFYHDSLFL